MKKTRRIKKTKSYFWHYLIVAALVFATAATASYFYLKPKLAFMSPFIESIESRYSGAKSPEVEEDSLRLYKSLQRDSAGIYDKSGQAALLVTAENVIKKYMASYDTKLLDLYMDKKGTIYADFSSELKKKFKGDAFDEHQIIAGLYRNIRVNVPNFNSLKILIEGKEIDSLGGHIDTSKPIGKEIESVIQRKTYRYF